MAERLLIGVFSLWLLLSLAVYIPAVGPVIRRYDWFALVPEWKFFAPAPAQHDYHLLYRDRLSGGCLTDWTEIKPLRERRWWNLVWNTAKRENKALVDIVSE